MPRREFDALVAMLGADDREHRQWREKLPEVMAEAVKSGVSQALQDPHVVDSLHAQLSRRTRQSVADWLLERVIMLLVTAALGASIAWFALTQGRAK